MEPSKKSYSIAMALSDNYGDDAQTLALAGLIDCDVRFYPRDFISTLNTSNTYKGILSGWISRNWSAHKDPEWLAQTIVPVGFHLITHKHYKDIWQSYFEHHARIYSNAIATRDTYTRDMLRASGVDANFGGCFSLFTSRAFNFAKIKNSDDPYIITTEKEYIESIVSESSKGIILYTQLFNPKNHVMTFSVYARISLNLFWLWLISESDSVYTMRLHASLPSLSYGKKLFFNTFNTKQYPGGSSMRMTGYNELLYSDKAKQGEVSDKDIDEFSIHLKQTCEELEDISFHSREPADIYTIYKNIVSKTICGSDQEIDKTEQGFRMGAYYFLQQLRFYNYDSEKNYPFVIKQASKYALEYRLNNLPASMKDQFDNYRRLIHIFE